MFDTKLTFMPTLIWDKRIKYHFDKIISNSFDCIDHFAINLIFPDNTAITLGSNCNYFMDYKKLQIDNIEVALSPGRLDNLSIVPWRLVLNKNDFTRCSRLVNFKEDRHNLYSGMTFINKIDDCYLTVAVATNKKDPIHALTLMKNMGEILNMGAYLYDMFKPELQTLYEKEFPELSEIILNDRQYLIADEFSKNWMDSRTFILPFEGQRPLFT